MIEPRANQRSPFNSPFEVGLRSLMILKECFPSSLELQQLVYLDYLLTHSGDVPNGPSSLHTATPYRSGEILVRRTLIADGLLLLASRNLVKIEVTANGITYTAEELAAPFIDRLTMPYCITLSARASWVIAQFGEWSLSRLKELFDHYVGEWGSEFEFAGDLVEYGETGNDQ